MAGAPRVNGRCTTDPGCQITRIEGIARSRGVDRANGFVRWDIQEATFGIDQAAKRAALDDDLFYSGVLETRDTTSCVSIRKQGLFILQRWQRKVDLGQDAVEGATLARRIAPPAGTVIAVERHPAAVA